MMKQALAWGLVVASLSWGVAAQAKQDGGGAMSQAQFDTKAAAMFDRLDTNHDAAVDKAEFAALKQPAAAEGANDAKNKPEKGKGLQVAAFKKSGIKKHAVSRQQYLAEGQRLFALADTDKNGALSQAERKAVLESMKKKGKKGSKHGGGEMTVENTAS